MKGQKEKTEKDKLRKEKINCLDKTLTENIFVSAFRTESTYWSNCRLAKLKCILLSQKSQSEKAARVQIYDILQKAKLYI